MKQLSDKLSKYRNKSVYVNTMEGESLEDAELRVIKENPSIFGDLLKQEITTKFDKPDEYQFPEVTTTKNLPTEKNINMKKLLEGSPESRFDDPVFAAASGVLEGYSLEANKKLEPFLNALLAKARGDPKSSIMTGQGLGEEYSAQKDYLDRELAKVAIKYPKLNTGGKIFGTFAPGSGPLWLWKNAGKLTGAGKIAATSPFLKKLLARGGQGALATAAGGQIMEEVDTPAEDRLLRLVIEAPIGAILNTTLGKVGDYITKARAPKLAEKVTEALKQKFRTVEDEGLRKKLIQEGIDQLNAGLQETKIGAGANMQKAFEKDISETSSKMKDFINKYVRGKTDEVSLTNARKYLQDFFQRNKLMDAKGNWIDETGRVIENIRPRAGVTEQKAEQDLLAEYWNDYFRNPTLPELQNLKKGLGKKTFKQTGEQRIISKQSPQGKKLYSALKTDEEEAIKKLYGEDVYKEYLGAKSQFHEMADKFEPIAKKLGIIKEDGEIISAIDPDQFLVKLSKLNRKELTDVLPYIKKTGMFDDYLKYLKTTRTLGEIKPASQTAKIAALEHRLTNDPKFAESFVKLKELLPEDTVNQIKGNVLENITKKAGSDMEKLYDQISNIPESTRKIIFNPDEIKMLADIEKYAKTSGNKSFLTKLLQGFIAKVSLGGSLKTPHSLTSSIVGALPEKSLDVLETGAKALPEKGYLSTSVIQQMINNLKREDQLKGY